MASGATIARRHRRISIIIVALVMLATLSAAGALMRFAGDASERELRAAARETLAVQAQALTGLMEKFRLLPNLVGRYPAITRALENPAGGNLALAERATLQIAALSGALDVLLLTPDGEVMVSGHGFSYEPIPAASPLLSAARQGRLGREVRDFGTRQTYAFAHAVRDGTGTITGIVAVLVDLATLEQAWSLSTNPVFVVDQAGTILVANREEWRMQPLFDIYDAGGGGARYWLEGVNRPYIDVVRNLPQLGWQLHVLADTAPIARARSLSAIAVAICGLAVALALISFANRQFAITRRQRRDRALALHLERVVRDRTSELTRSNKALAHEVEERKHAEESLRQMQSELIQTGKLAALGQMSTALSHEYNQPLAATKSYADNALAYLDRGRTEEARENIRLISQMTDRMASISKHLRNFARKPRSEIGSVPLPVIVDDALSVLSARIHAAGASMEVSHADPEVWVRGGHVRLQQVLVNLIGNALDAMAGQTAPTVVVHSSTGKDRVTVTVRDFGKGIDTGVIEQIFDPFFTTKPPGSGLGLGLSISYNIVKDFGGRLTAANHKEAGAIFTIELERGEPVSRAAE